MRIWNTLEGKDVVWETLEGTNSAWKRLFNANAKFWKVKERSGKPWKVKTKGLAGKGEIWEAFLGEYYKSGKAWKANVVSGYK